MPKQVYIPDSGDPDGVKEVGFTTTEIKIWGRVACPYGVWRSTVDVNSSYRTDTINADASYS